MSLPKTERNSSSHEATRNETQNLPAGLSTSHASCFVPYRFLTSAFIFTHVGGFQWFGEKHFYIQKFANIKVYS